MMLKKMGSFLPARSSKERSASEEPTTVDSSDVFLQATGTVGQLFSAELGVPVNELQQLKWEVEQLRRQLASASAPPPATVSKVHDPNEELEADATTSVAYAYITRVCRVSEVDAPTFVALLELLRSNPAYRALPCPRSTSSCASTARACSCSPTSTATVCSTRPSSRWCGVISRRPRLRPCSAHGMASSALPQPQASSLAHATIGACIGPRSPMALTRSCWTHKLWHAGDLQEGGWTHWQQGGRRGVTTDTSRFFEIARLCTWQAGWPARQAGQARAKVDRDRVHDQ